MKTTKIILSIVTVATLATSVYGACTSQVQMSGNRISGLGDPISSQDAATKQYIDAQVAIAIAGTDAPHGTTYKVINYGGKAWLDRNVGATLAATSYDDTTQASLGSLFQWGRAADGHQFRNGSIDNNDNDDIVVDGSGGTNKCTTLNEPDHSNFILGANQAGKYNWRTDADDCNKNAEITYLWGAEGSAYNGVCPTGWRVPSEQDFKALGITSAENAFEKIKLSAAGKRNYSDGSIQDVGLNGFYWTNNAAGGGKSSGLNIYSDGKSFSSYPRSYGYSVRCVKYLGN
jgi:uncharacterized protein (TIGR02145 family)